MSLTTYPRMEQRSAEWLAARRGMVTASVVGKLITPTLRVADNDTSRGIVATLAAERVSGFVDETPMTWDMARGVEDEPLAVEAYTGHRRVAVESCGFMVRALGGGLRLGYSPDGLVGRDGLIEVKCRRPKRHVADAVSGVSPGEHQAQIQAGLLVSGRDWCDYISFSDGLHLWIARAYPVPHWQDAIREAVAITEERITGTVTAYLAAVDGFPLTERSPFRLTDMIEV